MEQNKYLQEINRLTEAYREREQEQSFWGYKSWGILDINIEFSESQYKRSLLQTLRLQKFSYEQLQNAQVLEIGCGWGRNLQFFCELGVPSSHLTGIDIVEHNLQLAKKINPAIHYIKANAVEYNFQNKKFDIIIIHTVFSSILMPELHQKLMNVAVNLLSEQGALMIYDILPKYRTSATTGRDGKPLEYIRGVSPHVLVSQYYNQKNLNIKIDYLGLTPRWRNLFFIRPISNFSFYLANLMSLFKPANGYFTVSVRKVKKS